MKGHALRVGLLGALFAALCADVAFAQCSMCRAVVTQSPEGQRMAGELNRAILVMFAAPYLVFGSFAAWIFRSRLGAFLRRSLGPFLLPR
jgi:hypothetical protein